ncbi:MAG: V-type ATP synthase subunit I [Candidatus Ornithomonoglobus sp.]
MPMSRITIYGNKKDRKAVLEFLQRKRIIDISEPEEETVSLGFERINTGEARAGFLRSGAVGERALEVLERYAPEEKKLTASLNGRKSLTAEEYYGFVEDIPEMQRIAKRIIELSEDIAERQGQILRYKAEIDELEPWMGLDIAMSGEGTKKSVSFTGVFDGSLSEEQIIEKYNAGGDAPAAYFEVVNSMPQQTYVLVICAAKDKEQCEALLRRIGFSAPRTEYKGIPREETAQRRRLINALEKENEALTSEIISCCGARNAIRFMSDYYSMRAEKYSVLSKLGQHKRVFIIQGYVPENAADGLIAELEHKYNAAAEVEPAGADAPVMLKNPYLAEPVEGVVRTFAMPAPNEIDPTTIMAFFYYIFFGLMLSDAAYGLIMTLGCGIVLKKFKNMESGLKNTLRMFMYCGISTMFWGILFGSWFGDAIEVVSGTFFGHAVKIPPLWFEPVKDPIKMLMFSFLFGLIHLFTALGIKLYQCVKAKDYMSALTDCIFWYMLVGGGVVYLFRVDMFLSMTGLTFKLPAVWANVAAVCAGIGALGILLLSSRSGSPAKRLAKGAYSLYGVTSWLGDILSYSRLLALGLATGVIATVFNSMGSMFGGGILGAVIFTLVFIIGHALNLGINLLSAYVHTNRLQFVEFFGKFYDGGGREFEPFSTKTTYYKLEED